MGVLKYLYIFRPKKDKIEYFIFVRWFKKNNLTLGTNTYKNYHGWINYGLPFEICGARYLSTQEFKGISGEGGGRVDEGKNISGKNSKNIHCFFKIRRYFYKKFVEKNNKIIWNSCWTFAQLLNKIYMSSN